MNHKVHKVFRKGSQSSFLLTSTYTMVNSAIFIFKKYELII